MPFTFSHPAILLPFLKNKKLSATALIVGSMSPDFEYFFRMKMQSEISHTLLGIFLIDLPLGFIVMFAFHEIIKRPLIENLPAFLQNRLQELKEFNWVVYFKSAVFIVLISFFLGAVSHIVWDSMTHWDGYIVQRFSFFNLELFSIPFYKIAQHASSIIGLGWILFYIYKLPEKNENSKIVDFNYWSFSIVFTAVFIAVRFYFGIQLNQIGNAIVSIISPTILAITLTGLIFRNKKTI
ncbi:MULTISPECIES: DUF4184 family protein [Flavobacterium]|jgi:hypothetical protein|uniref:DUF4184 family protein n=1 Tax=Flavobacterium TaxID=237 RepID=UPI0013E41AF4|nr:DUF4184 family protein [Flavobacterium sp. Sr18]QIH39210.1 DUF4184 family protein [Flavobacterium sp. Sr18]